MRAKRKSEFKQLQFDTAIRNPERYKVILESIKDFEGRILDDNCLLGIVTKLYLNKIVRSEKIDIDFVSDEKQLKRQIIQVNSTRKSDGGFPEGYQSRFWTYMRTLSEFGFVYARYNKPLRLSKIAKALINQEIDEQEAFSSLAMVFNRKSPYKNVSNDFNYFTFLLKILLELKKKNKKLHFTRFVLSMYAKTEDVKSFLKDVKKLEFSNETDLFEYIKENYKDNKRAQTTLKDYPDAVLRLLRIMGFITIYSQGGLFISINDNNIEYIDNLLKFCVKYSEEEKDNAELFFEKIGEQNDELLEIIKIHRKKEIIDEKIHSKKLKEIIENFKLTEEIISSMINKLGGKASKTTSGIEEFKYIPEPLKLEFYISILLYMKYGKEMFVKPNYKIDGLGIPISHAPANIGDIEVFNSDLYWLIEVTLIRNKTQQLNSETTCVMRHLNNTRLDERIKRYLSFVAPFVHEDTKQFYDVSLTISHSQGNIVYLKPFVIKDFISSVKNERVFEEIEEYTNLTIEKIRNF